MTFRKTIDLPRRFLIAALLPFAVIACEAPNRQSDYEKAYPLPVSTKAYVMALKMPAAGVGLAGESALDFRRFVGLYHDRARSVVTIEASADSGDQALAAAQRARRLLMGAGLGAKEIVIVRGAGRAETGGAVVLSFTGNAVKAPACGDWSSSPTFNWSNKSQTNFGCAFQRNLGLTVADPGDLKSARTMSGGDAAKSIGVLKSWRNPGGGAASGVAAGAAASGGATTTGTAN